MTKKRAARWVKGTLVSAAAACTCYEMWISLQEWAWDVSIVSEGAMGAGWFEALLATCVGLLSMPGLLWVGMRLLGEQGNHVLVLGGAAAWWPVGGHIVEGAGSNPEAVLILALFVLVGGLLSLVKVPNA